MDKKITLKIDEDLLEKAQKMNLNLKELLESSIKNRIPNPTTSTTSTSAPSKGTIPVTTYYHTPEITREKKKTDL